MRISTFTAFLFPSQSLLSVHDAVAQRDFEPTLPPMPDDVLEEDEDSVKIVSLVKTKEPLVSKHVFMFPKSKSNPIQNYFSDTARLSLTELHIYVCVQT